jgi:hypothetical protein
MFKSPDQALAFAFRMRHSHVVSLPSGTYLAQKTDHQHSSDRLTQYDLHAQAGMIFSWLSRRPEEDQIYAFYLHGTIRERRVAASLIIRRNKERLAGYKLSHVQLRNAVLGRSVRDVSDASGLSQYKAWRLRRDLAEIFEPIQERLMTAMQDELISSNTAV